MNAETMIKAVRGSTTVRLGDRNVEVRELSWPDALSLLQSLGEVVPTLLAMRAGGLEITVETVRKLVLSTASLSDALLQKATGLSADETKELGFSAGIALLAASLDVNLSEEVLGNAKLLGAAIARIAPSTPKPEPGS